jgi:hypothetical protein
MSEEIARELSGHLIRISTPETRKEMSPDDLEYVARVAIGHALNLHDALEASLSRERGLRDQAFYLRNALRAYRSALRSGKSESYELRKLGEMALADAPRGSASEAPSEGDA